MTKSDETKDAVVRISKPLRDEIKKRIAERARKGERPRPTQGSAIQEAWDLERAVDEAVVDSMKKSGSTLSEVILLGLKTLELMSHE